MTTIHVDLIGGRQAVTHLDGIGERAVNMSPAFREISNVLQEGEKRVFRGGKFVRTGDLMRALTQEHDQHAIRDVHSDGQGLTFGAAIWYAHFLKTPNRKSAVLRLQPKERKASLSIAMRYLVGGPAV